MQYTNVCGLVLMYIPEDQSIHILIVHGMIWPRSSCKDSMDRQLLCMPAKTEKGHRTLPWLNIDKENKSEQLDRIDSSIIKR